MIARFSGRSTHTYRIKNKPTLEGYKILSLCDFGYTYAFIFLSRIHNHPDIQNIPGLNKTSCEVWHLVNQLPSNKIFNIYMDNFFSNINLFKFLRDRNIGACGTTHVNSTKFPKSLKIKEKLDWDTLLDKVVDNVLALLWIDNGPVTMLTTIHEIGLQHHIQRLRRRPRINNINATRIQNVFGNESKKILPIPTVIDDYNHFMGGVDIASQLHSSYIIQFPIRRTWIPLFFWIIDTAIINSYIIFNFKNNNKIKHKEFRLEIIWQLIETGLKLDGKIINDEQEIIPSTSNKKVYVTENFKLPMERFILGNHLAEYRNKREACIWCRYKTKQENKKALKDPLRSYIWCNLCNIALCCNSSRNCFKEYHNLSMNEID